MLRRQGTPFWDYLDRAGVRLDVLRPALELPGEPVALRHHRCLCGMGTPDMLGTYGTYQHFAEDGPARRSTRGAGHISRLAFENDAGPGPARRPEDALLKKPRPIEIPFLVHRDREANAAVIEIQGRKLVLKAGAVEPLDAARVHDVDAGVRARAGVPGLCRFYLQQVARGSACTSRPSTWTRCPAQKISEPPRS